MGLFSSSKSKSETTNLITDRRIGASGGSVVAADGGRVDIRSSDPAVLRDALKQSISLANTAIETATRQADSATRTVIDAAAAGRAAEQDLVAKVVAGEATAGGEILRTVLLVVAVGGVVLVLMSRGGR